MAFAFRPDIIVGENLSSFRLARSIKARLPEAKLITDLHGACPEECLFNYTDPVKREMAILEATASERDIALNSEFVICQSENMIEHLRAKYPGTKAQFHPFQCSVRLELFQYKEAMRERYRKKLVLKDETLFIYSGSFNKWQNIRYAVEIFAKYLKAGGASAKLLILSPSPGDEILDYGYSIGLTENEINILKVPHEEVPGYLNAADIGFLIRDDSVVNRVASPTKLGEYLACGLPVIVGPVAHSWPVAKLDGTCFCFVGLEDAGVAALSILNFLKTWGLRPADSRNSAASLAARVLSNQKETERLNSFILDNVLERKQ